MSNDRPGQRIRRGHPRPGDPGDPQRTSGDGGWKASPWWSRSPSELKKGDDGTPNSSLRRAARSIRMEVSGGVAGQLRRRCLRDRDGDHQPVPARRASRPAAGTSRSSTRSPIPEDKSVNQEDPNNTATRSATTSKSFTRFMRSTRASPGTPTPRPRRTSIQGEKLFRNNNALGLRRLPPSGSHDAGAGDADRATHVGRPKRRQRHDHRAGRPWASKVIHPYSDFLLHDVGAGDGIARRSTPRDRPGGSRTSISPRRDHGLRGDRPRPGSRSWRSSEGPERRGPGPRPEDRQHDPDRAALGAATRPQLLHDGSATNIDEAIRRHAGQAVEVTNRYIEMSRTSRPGPAAHRVPEVALSGMPPAPASPCNGGLSEDE